MKDCCAVAGAEIFNERTARKDARRYRKKGLEENARRLVDFLTRSGLEGASILEVGGGVGAIELELLAAGAARAVNVELSPAYEPYARELIAEAGVEGRVVRRILDFARDHESVGPADVVVMHKVVCCYPDLDGLVVPAAERARRVLALTYPRDTWLNRFGARLVNIIMRVLRREFRTFVHPPERIASLAEAHGLEPIFEHEGRIWEQLGLERV